MQTLGNDFLANRPGVPSSSHQSAYRRAVKMMRSSAAKAFDLDEEPAAVHDAYGRNPFGQGCLLARRLVERGVPFVEVTLSSVDGGQWRPGVGHPRTEFRRRREALRRPRRRLVHPDDRPSYSRPARQHLDRLDGRVRPDAEDQRVRRPRPFPNAWSTVLAGGGIRGGQTIGDTGADGEEVKDRPVLVPDLLATVIKGLGIDPAKQNTVENGRPIRLVDPKANPIKEVLG